MYIPYNRLFMRPRNLCVLAQKGHFKYMRIFIYAFRVKFLINATCDSRVWYGRREYGVSYTRKHSARISCVYKAIWTPVVRQVLHVQSEDSNKYDRFAVAICAR